MAGSWGKVITVIAVMMSIFHLYSSSIGLMLAIKQRAFHLAFVLLLVFLLYPARKGAPKGQPTWLDVILGLTGAATSLYVAFNIDAYSLRGSTPTTFEIVLGGITLILIIEGARRALGKELPIIASVFLLYGYFGPYFPGFLAHRGFPWRKIIEQMYLTDLGVFGQILGVSSTFIFLFILFGAFLEETKMGSLFNEISLALAGHTPGGPAKVTVIGAGLMGMINGSAAANVATTGSFTIPLMKKIGYDPYFAAGVSAASSTGGQIMPPIMGAAAFVMAEFLGVSYTRIMLAAAIPATLYYLCIWFAVDIRARRIGLRGMPKSDLPSLGKVLRNRGHLLIPIIAIVYLLIRGITPIYAAFWGIALTVVCSFFKKDTRLTLKGLLRALESGAKQAVGVAIACAVVGIVIGILSLTSLGLVFTDQVIRIAHGSLLLTMILTMVACIVLGMGLPTTACYIVAATVAAPALVKLNVPPLVAHMFVFYYACLSAVTPPVALAAYTAAGLTGVDPNRTGWVAAKLALAGFIVPFVTVYSPMLLLIDVKPIQLIWAVITSSIGTYLLAASLEGYFKRTLPLIHRFALFAASLLLITPGLATDLIGASIAVLVWLLQSKAPRVTVETPGSS
ncbi:MAG TPA: TRAP transporter permease [Firmicutes bacterium]|nr:TRAP transporter permease [Bacillota bacterium]